MQGDGAPPRIAPEDRPLESTTAAVADIARRIQNTRRELLDLSARNRLISTPRGVARGRKIEIVDERSEDVFRLLVRERKSMSFLPGAGETEEDGDTASQLGQPEDAAGADVEPDPRHTDLRLQTRLASERLQARLLDMYYDAQTYEQEQGVSILYIALGFLKWFESSSSDKPRYAPLLLVPVELERPSAASRFHLRCRDEDITTNLSLQAKLKAEFGVELPDVPDMEELAPTAYFDSVARAVENQPRWEVLCDDMLLWFFSFAKFLMYRDLDPASWPADRPLASNPTLASLLGDGFVSEPPWCDDDAKLDGLIAPADMVHVTDADSSQSVVIEEVRRGRHLVVQGPPGTGKSQTITNLIATAFKGGKKVLFVAEKMAALEVVHGRMQRLGLDGLCLELHSHKASKKAVLEELQRTLALGRPKAMASDERIERLQEAIGRLNRHAEVMNTPMGPSGLTPFQVIGRLSALYGRGHEPTDLGLAGLASWTAAQFHENRREVEDLKTQLDAIGNPRDHAWRGVDRLDFVLHAESKDFFADLDRVAASLQAVAESGVELASSLGLSAHPDATPRDVQQVTQFAIRLVKSPPMDRTRISDPAWANRPSEIAALVERGRTLSAGRYLEQFGRLGELSKRLDAIGPPGAHSFRGVRRTEPFTSEEAGAWPALIAGALGAVQDIAQLARRVEATLRLSVRPDPTFKDVQQLTQLALRIVRAPALDRAQIAHPVWESDRDRIEDIVERGRSVASARGELAGKVADIGWQTDLSATRMHLAGRGGSLYRWFSRDYRNAVATLKGVLNGDPPRALADRLRIVDAVLAAQALERLLDEDAGPAQAGRDAFGSLWKGARSDWARLAEIVAWDGDCRSARLAHDHRAVLSGLESQDLDREPIDALCAGLKPAFDRLKSLVEALKLDLGEAFDVVGILSIPIPAVVDRLREWLERAGDVAGWIEYQSARRRLELAGLSEAAAEIHAGRLSVELAVEDLQSRFRRELEHGIAGNAGESPPVGLGREAFGAEWKGVATEWDRLAAIIAWDRECRDAALPWDHRGHLARLDDLGPLRALVKEIVAFLNGLPGPLQSLFHRVKLDLVAAFEQESYARIPLHTLLSRLRRWRDDSEALSHWIRYQRKRSRLRSAQLDPLVDALHEGRIPADAAVPQLEIAYYQALIHEVFRSHPNLAEFDGRTYANWVEEFRSLDLARIELARREVAAAHYDGIPRNAAGGEMAVLRRELEKKRRHKSIRRLLKETGTAVLSIKPVFMMSPISVAQFLEPGGVTFDLLIVDEASQVSPVDALGAMARARQLVVVGDDKQLPPTRFFSKMLDESVADPDAEDDLQAGDLESILGLCVAQGMSQRMLRWHYRSRHHSLIAVSNREFYENRLYVVPSPTTIAAMHGLHFRMVKDGVFDRGGSATNRVEAKAIAEAVVEHAKMSPTKSLGVGAFSVAQRDAIRDELEVLQREHVELASFFSPGRPEPFFVKNLENIQGDERDVIFISVGYGRDASGYLAMNFGPLSTQGGERRLNVLISRARERCEVFSSITADDVDLQRARSRGAAAFKTFLRYAATGVLDSQEPTGRDYDSDFERQVAVALNGRGWEVHRQVGTAGFVIDLAVVDPECPGRYLVGVECDGATYHSSRSARDRDRLREAVLRDRGWRIHRVWSTDWFHRPGEQLQRIIDSLEDARRDANADELGGGAEEERLVEPTNGEPAIDRDDSADAPADTTPDAWSTPYAEARFDVPLGVAIHDMGTSDLASIVLRIVEIEGPIHRDELARRVTSLWGLQRTGNRIVEAVSRAVDVCKIDGAIKIEGEFVSHIERVMVSVRNRLNVSSANLKKPEMIPPSEIRQAILNLTREQPGLDREEASLLTARALGFRATSGKLRESVHRIINELVDTTKIDIRDGKLFVAE